MLALSGAHNPQIEGLRHGGMAEKTRHSLTDFGSGYRGLIGLDKEAWDAVTGHPGRGMNTDLGQFQSKLESLVANKEGTLSTSRLGYYQGKLQEVKDAVQWQAKSGQRGLIFNTAGLNRSTLKQVISHERIHGLHHQDWANPWLQQKIAETPSLESLINSRMGSMYPDLNPSQLAQRQKEAITHYQGKANPEGHEYAERLAYGYQDDRGFMREAHQRGLGLQPKDLRSPKYEKLSKPSEPITSESITAPESIKSMESRLKSLQEEAKASEQKEMLAREAARVESKAKIAETRVWQKAHGYESVAKDATTAGRAGLRPGTAGIMGCLLAAGAIHYMLNSSEGHDQKHRRSIKEGGSRRTSRGV